MSNSTVSDEKTTMKEMPDYSVSSYFLLEDISPKYDAFKMSSNTSSREDYNFNDNSKSSETPKSKIFEDYFVKDVTDKIGKLNTEVSLKISKFELEDRCKKIEKRLSDIETKAKEKSENEKHKFLFNMGIGLFCYSGAIFFSIIAFNVFIANFSFIAKSSSIILDSIYKIKSGTPENNLEFSQFLYLIVSQVGPIAFLVTSFGFFYFILKKIAEILKVLPKTAEEFLKKDN